MRDPRHRSGSSICRGVRHSFVHWTGDGVVAWQACNDRVNPTTEHVEVAVTHLCLGFSPDVFALIADRLAD